MNPAEDTRAGTVDSLSDEEVIEYAFGFSPAEDTRAALEALAEKGLLAKFIQRKFLDDDLFCSRSTEQMDADALLSEFIVIPKADLPKVETDPRLGPDWISIPGMGTGYSHLVEDNVKFALAYLAAALYRAENPPLDEAKVNAIATLLSNESDGGLWEHLGVTNSREVARALVRLGINPPERKD